MITEDVRPVPTPTQSRWVLQFVNGWGSIRKHSSAAQTMPNLIATGNDEQQYWRRELPLGETIRLGRAPRQGWAVPWDMSVSREHADL